MCLLYAARDFPDTSSASEIDVLSLPLQILFIHFLFQLQVSLIIFSTFVKLLLPYVTVNIKVEVVCIYALLLGHRPFRDTLVASLYI